MTKSDSPLSPDTPISSIKEDKFGRADFANNLAKSIAGVPAEDGFVFALNAPWGSGKTSTLKMVQEYLGEASKVDDGKQFIIVNFNPWWFSGGDSLVHDFFGQFNGALTDQGKRIGKVYQKRVKNLAKHVHTLSGMLSPVAGALSLDPSIGAGLAAIKGVGGGIRRLAFPEKNIHQIRQEIDKSLKGDGNSSLRVLVVMDDLDRIQPNEMQEMFRLVKGVADFPNTIYLLSFDRDVVINAISSTSVSPINGLKNAENYLGKITQMSLDLPPVERVRLLEYFNTQLEKIFPQMEEWDFGYWDANIFYDGASHFIKTPRDVKRWLNNVIATYPAVCGEVYSPDFVAIQGLRTFTPHIYHAIGENKSLFVNVPVESKYEAMMRILHSEHIMELRQKAVGFRKIFEKSDNGLEEHAEKIVSALFPFWRSHFSEIDVDFEPSLLSTEEEKAFEFKMVRHPQIFDRFFILSLPIGDFSDIETMRMISLAADPFVFANVLLELADEHVPGKGMRLRIFLGCLLELQKSNEVLKNTSGIVGAFLSIGDKPKIAEKWLDFTDFENISNFMRKIAQALLENIPDENTRFEICRNAYENSEAIKTMWEWIHTFRASLSSYKQGRRDRPVLEQEHCEVLEKIAAEKLRELAKKGNIWDWPNPFQMLHSLNEAVGIEERRDCVRKAIATPEGFADFVAEWLETHSPDGWEKLVELSLEEIVNRARKSLKENPQLSNKRKKALRDLIYQIENPLPII